ncbi:hypothetical protein M422DRAFT_149509 [Sphaerobolus stellatus SS14]|nr:hypothetical protein M422DRAFT_149509 [Sphaerobolus stellatus SS14]
MTASSSKKSSKVAKSTPIAPKPKSAITALQPLAGPSETKPEHVRLLATKWMASGQLKQLTESEGLVFKKGKFSKKEENALDEAIERYRTNCAMTEEQMTELIGSKNKQEMHNQFWFEIASAVPGRPLISIYHHVQRTHNPLKLQGKWTSEEDTKLIQAVKNLGAAWTQISDCVGRAASDCRDRWRNHLAIRGTKRTGKWTKEEEDKLIRIVLEVTGEQGNIDDGIFWGEVSKRMGEQRGRQQCRIKWTDSLSSTIKTGGDSPRWTRQDAHILVQRLAALDIKDDSEIDWKKIPDETWNLWSVHILQRRYRTMKNAIKGYEQMPFKGTVPLSITYSDC